MNPCVPGVLDYEENLVHDLAHVKILIHGFSVIGLIGLTGILESAFALVSRAS